MKGEGMMEYNFELKKGKEGLLLDERKFKILEIPSIMMNSKGEFKYGDIKLEIENEIYVMRIEEFVKNVKQIGDLEIKKL